MLEVLGWILVVAVLVAVVVKVMEVAWKLKIAVKKVGRKVSENKIAAFFVKGAMYAYFALVVAIVDKAINN